MLQFRPLSIGDKALFEGYVKRYGSVNCDLSFANCMIWSSDVHLCEVDGFFVLRFKMGHGRIMAYSQPMGEGDTTHVLRLMAEDAASHDMPLRIFNMSERFASALDRDRFYTYTNRNFSDYIYPAEQLRGLHGRHLQPKRNHVNSFMRSYDYRVEALTKGHRDEVFELLNRWSDAKLESNNRAISKLEMRAIVGCFDNFEELGIQGVALYVEDGLIAFSCGSEIASEPPIFDIHFEKADVSYKGVFAMINRLLAESLPERYTLINREEDMGIMGLRKSKLSYMPQMIHHKWYAIERESVDFQILDLWQRVFGDDDSFVTTYLNGYSKPENRVVEVQDGAVVSMVHIPQFRSRYGTVGYIYGVATEASYRGSGYATKLTNKALDLMRSRGDVMAVVIPADQKLRENYRDLFGFSSCGVVEFRSDLEFDFGTGDRTFDMGMYRILDMECGVELSEDDTLELTFGV